MIRPVTVADAAAICAIYNYYILNTTVSFEEQGIAEADMVGRIDAATLPWLVWEEGGVVLGYTYATPWRVRPAYRYSAEAAIYVASGATGRTIGMALYQHLIERVRERGLHSLIGGIALPNEVSVKLHQRLGFRKVAHFEQVGWKFGRWIDVGYWQLQLASAAPVPSR